MSNAIEVEDVTKVFRLYSEKFSSLKERVIHGGKNPFQEFYALKNVSLEIQEGTSVGLLGHNGSGKSTLLKTIAGIIQPNSGEIRVKGRVSAMLEVGAGFHPELSGRDNIFLSATLLGVPVKEVKLRFDEIVEFSELGQFIDNQVKYYSSGMYARLGFAVAVNVDPDVLLVDEVLAVGDENFQRKCIDRIKSFQKDGRTIVFVSHSPDLVRAICDFAYVLDHGSLIGKGSPADAIAELRDSLNRTKGQVGGAIVEAAGSVSSSTPVHEEQAIAITSISAVADGEQSGDSTRIAPHDPLKIVINYAARRQVGGANITLSILAANGEAVFSANSEDLKIDPFDIDSDGVFELYFDTVPLLDGTYGLAVTINDHMRSPIAWVEEKVGFQVVNPSLASGLVALEYRVNSFSRS
ncbi:MAG: ABC transporter ATP-binding protein [Actinomycetota bacterium]|nr:ABC transporter ATP-binding protein [Actinomycetota bacterium]